MAAFNGVKNPNIQGSNTDSTIIKKKGVNFNQGAAFQSALNQARNKEDKKKDNPAPASSPAPSSNTSAPTNSANASSGFGAPANGSNTSLRGHMAAGVAPGFKDDTSGRVEQELNNQLIQSGLQSQVLKNAPSSGQDNS